MLTFCDNSLCNRVLLSEAKTVGEYEICKIAASGSLKKRINSLYIEAGRKITLLYAKNGKVIIGAGGVKIGISRSVAQKIEVSPYENNQKS